jgi:hypothetical protein
MKISRFFSVALAALVWTFGVGTTLAANIEWYSDVNEDEEFYFFRDDEGVPLAKGSTAWLVYLVERTLGNPADMFDSSGTLDSTYYQVADSAAIGSFGPAGTIYKSYTYDYAVDYSPGDKFVIMAFNAEFASTTQAPLSAFFGVSQEFTIAGGGTFADEFNLDQDYSTVHPVPEPGALALFGLGALGMLVRRRKATNI